MLWNRELQCLLDERAGWVYSLPELYHYCMFQNNGINVPPSSAYKDILGLQSIGKKYGQIYNILNI
jgi:hypothetical protein